MTLILQVPLSMKRLMTNLTKNRPKTRNNKNKLYILHWQHATKSSQVRSNMDLFAPNVQINLALNQMFNNAKTDRFITLNQWAAKHARMSLEQEQRHVMQMVLLGVRKLIFRRTTHASKYLSQSMNVHRCSQVTKAKMEQFVSDAQKILACRKKSKYVLVVKFTMDSNWAVRIVMMNLELVHPSATKME